MLYAALVLSWLVQEPPSPDDPIKAMDIALAARQKAFPKFTAGAMADALRTVLTHGVKPEEKKDYASAAAVYDAGADAIMKFVLAMENRPTELRKAVGILDKARKRAAALDGDEKKVAALRYGLHRAFLVYQLEVAAVSDLFNLAVDFVGAGFYGEAEEALKEVEDRVPALQAATMAESAQALRWVPLIQSRIHLARGQYKDAAETLRSGLVRAPDWVQQEIDISKIYKKDGEAARVAKAIDEHLKKNPDDADAMLLRAHDMFFSAGRKKSQALFEALLKKDPENKAAKFFLENMPEERR